MSYADASENIAEFYTNKKKFGIASESFKSGIYISLNTEYITDKREREIDGCNTRPPKASHYCSCSSD
jgi:hypothetical protein